MAAKGTPRKLAAFQMTAKHNTPKKAAAKGKKIKGGGKKSGGGY